MSDFTNQLNSYEREITDELQKIKRAIFSCTEFDFFLKEVENHYLYDFKNCPKIIVFGSSIPEELLCGTGAYYILGGSRISSMWADDVVPRDTDPVSKSSFGYIKSGFAKKSLILIPLINDNTRKLAYILKSMGLKVHTVHFPPIKDNASLKEWKRQYEACWSAIAFHLKKPITKRTLQKHYKKIQEIKKQIQYFMEVSEGVISGSCRIFILNSYYCTNNILEWGVHLKYLTEKLKKEQKDKNNKKAKVLLLGSPMYFPNNKIPFLIEEAGLEIALQADVSTLQTIPPISKSDLISDFYNNDVSSAYIKNNSLHEKVKKMISEKEIDGIVYHVLKGQIEHDFELGYFEKLFEKKNIPIFRIETDYNYQDIEQLRIRLEAFSEVLNQRKYTKEAITL